MLLNPNSARRWLATGASLVAASTLVMACGGEVGPADGEDSMETTGGSTNRSTGTTRSGAVTTPRSNGGSFSTNGTAQGATKALPPSGTAGPGADQPPVTVGQGGWSSQGPGKRTSAGSPSTSVPTPTQGGSVATSVVAGPTCRNGVRDGDACNPSYDLTECVVRTTRICKCDAKKSVWECRANDQNAGGTSSAGGQVAVAGGKSDSASGGKHGDSDPVAGQASVNLAGSGGA